MNIFSVVIQSQLAPSAILVPVPISGGAGKREGLAEVTEAVGERLGLPVLRAVKREKGRSTRRSVAQIRRQIVLEEYYVDGDVAQYLAGATVVLLDDNVTTGVTMGGVASLLRASGAAVIIPVTLDRTISARLRQRLAERIPIGCAHGG